MKPNYPNVTEYFGHEVGRDRRARRAHCGGPALPTLIRCLILLCVGSVPIYAEGIDYHAVPPTDDVRPFVVASKDESPLDEAQLTKLLQSHVKYVFVLYQENRSFDSYFGTFPGADGLFSRPSEETPGFAQEIINTDGLTGTIRPFCIGPAEFAADIDDLDHSHPLIVAKMDVQDGQARMDHFALAEEKKYSPTGHPSLQAKQFGELAMAYEDGDTVPLLWRYANRFVLFDRIFQLMTGPSTPGNLSIIGAQSGVTQWLLHPDEAYAGNGSKGKGLPMLNDAEPFWGSPLDHSTKKMPFNPRDLLKDDQYNLTFATIPLTLRGGTIEETTKSDTDPDDDLADVKDDITEISAEAKRPIAFGWYQEGYDREPTDAADPVDAEGRHASYVTHHNGPQYFGYVSNNPKMRADLHGLTDFFDAVDHHTLPESGGVFFVKGGYQNTLGLKPADPNKQVQANFKGDDDHPAYSDAQISEALVAETVNKIAASPYWANCAIIITWDDSEGLYDHVPPPIRAKGPDDSIISDGPRVPLLLISPYARVHTVCHASGDHASVVKFIDRLFGLKPLAELPDEERARKIGASRYGTENLGPADALTPDITDLVGAFDPARLSGKAAALPASYVMIPENLVQVLPQTSGYGCRELGIVPVDRALGIKNQIPPDFNPRPKTDPTPDQPGAK
jgi:phospholipase C